MEWLEYWHKIEQFILILLSCLLTLNKYQQLWIEFEKTLWNNNIFFGVWFSSAIGCSNGCRHTIWRMFVTLFASISFVNIWKWVLNRNKKKNVKFLRFVFHLSIYQSLIDFVLWRACFLYKMSSFAFYFHLPVPQFQCHFFH